MKEKLYNDLGLDNGEDILKKFNLSEFIDDEEDAKKEEEKREKNKKIKEINENI